MSEQGITTARLAVTWLKTGYCTHPEAVTLRGGRWQSAQFPALVALLQHPTEGYILFDTGYSQRFFAETRRWPNRAYALVTPVYLEPGESAAQQLQQRGIAPDAIRHIVISHFHADHIGGLWDFPEAQFICARSAYENVKLKKGVRAVSAGFLPGLLPPDFEPRVSFVEDRPTVRALPEGFETGFDVFCDRTLIAVELPGHAAGQLGLRFTDPQGHTYFLVADSCWSSRAYRELIEPHPIAQLIFDDAATYRDTLRKLHHLHKAHPNIRIVPTHCNEFWRSQHSLQDAV
ncbi:MAG: MBL fold metallo-hydrolase [Cyanobacteria bacterium J06554_6]